jgi:hypothetical protein
MKYNELINFEPIESVVQLRDTEKEEEAKRLVKTYVFSDEMVEKLESIILPLIQYDVPLDNKGLFIVGNYGTGKSHLMSVIASIAENTDLLKELQSEKLKESFLCIAGRFEVVRIEIGSTLMGLREMLIAELENKLKMLGVTYSFPDVHELINHKTAFEDMMAAFHQKYPDAGLMLIVDELLDYLRTRKDQEIILDLNFLREVGEVCKDLRFRFVSGVQEAIFDSPSFEYVASSIKRVKDRFEQVLIARNDIKFVVSKRLLKKNTQQIDTIKSHLLPFAKYYSDFNERIDDFTRMFPVHPDYIDTFERITIIEKREVLKTLSLEMRNLLNRELPKDSIGLIAFDSYWNAIKQNPAFRAVPQIRDVIECSQVLEAKITTSFSRKHLMPLAIRLIYALSVHRLTTGDLYSQIGISAKELRDRICLYHPLIEEMGSEEPDKDLETLVKTVLREIHKTVNGQFISYNETNDQYYLDLKKVEDFDAHIQTKAETLNDDKLDRYYFEALKRVMECQDTTHVTGYKIWQHELIWQKHNAGRTGYLFFGTPNERSTAVPSRDFYLYFIQPHDTPRYHDNKLADEVFFKIKKDYEKLEDFTYSIRMYAASLELASTSAGHAKSTYISKSNEYLKMVVKWLQHNVFDAFEVTCQGRSKKIKSWLTGDSIRNALGLAPNQTTNFRDLINVTAASCLETHFCNQAPEYPTFSVLITEQNRKQAAKDALRAISGQAVTKQATAVLFALNLLDDDRVSVTNSPYATYILTLLQNKEQGQVLNRSELLIDDNGIEYMSPAEMRLEPEWMVVVISALVYSGDVIMTIPGKKIDATSLSFFVSSPLDVLIAFKHLERPKDWNIAAIKALYSLVNLAPGLALMITQGKDEAIQSLQQSVNNMVNRIVMIKQHLLENQLFWGNEVFTNQYIEDTANSLNNTKMFLESLQPYNKPAKLKNLRYSTDEIQSHCNSVKQLEQLEMKTQSMKTLLPITTWLSNAENALSKDHPWVSEIANVRNQIISQFNENETKITDELPHTISTLKNLQNEYMDIYIHLHTKARLGVNEDKRKADLINDDRMKTLIKLAGINLMPIQQLKNLQDKLASKQSCFALTIDQLQQSPICPHCGYRPSIENKNNTASVSLDELDMELDDMIDSWADIVLKNLQDPVTQENIKLLHEDNAIRIEAFIQAKTLPVPIDSELIHAIKEVLSGLVKVSINSHELFAAITKHGRTLTKDELKVRFDAFVNEKTRGINQENVRIVLE